MLLRRVVPSALVIVAASLAACGDDTTANPPATSSASTTTATTAFTEPVVREILAATEDPPGAPGRTLTLARYTIQPGAKLPAHVHPGIQMAWIESGTLTYTIESGTAQVQRAGTEQPEPVEGPTTITLQAGDAVLELGDMVHFGANTSDEPIVIYASLLTESGKDLAVAVEE
jgi:quercetin dioxygenase-like cupin family protein